MERSKHADVIVSISNSLSQGVSDLAAGRVYHGAKLPSGVDETSNRINKSESNALSSKSAPARRYDRRAERFHRQKKELVKRGNTRAVMKHIPQWLKQEMERSADPSSSSESNSDLEEHHHKEDSDRSSDDSFLEFSREEIEDGVVDLDDEATIMQAAAAQGRAVELLKDLRTDERVELMEQVFGWYKRRYVGALTDVEGLETQQEFRDEIERSLDQSLVHVRQVLSAKEIRVLLKTRRFMDKVRRLGRGPGSAVPDDEMSNSRAADRRGTAAQQSSIDAQVKLVATKLMLAQQDAGDKPNPGTVAATMPELLQIIGQQQDEINAHTGKVAARTNRVRTLEACVNYLKTANATNNDGDPGNPTHMDLGSGTHALPKDGMVGKMVQGVMANVLQQKVKARMAKDMPFCRSVWKVLETEYSKHPLPVSSTGGARASIMIEDVDGERQKQQLEDECSELEAEIERLLAWRDSGQLEEELDRITEGNADLEDDPGAAASWPEALGEPGAPGSAGPQELAGGHLGPGAAGPAGLLERRRPGPLQNLELGTVPEEEGCRVTDAHLCPPSSAHASGAASNGRFPSPISPAALLELGPTAGDAGCRAVINRCFSEWCSNSEGMPAADQSCSEAPEGPPRRNCGATHRANGRASSAASAS